MSRKPAQPPAFFVDFARQSCREGLVDVAVRRTPAGTPAKVVLRVP